MAPEIAEAMVAAGGKQFYLNGLCWNRELFGAAARAIEAAGGISAVHVQPSSFGEVNAVIAAEEGVSMIVHHYGYAESALDRTVPDYPRDYDYYDENERFRQAAKVWETVGRNPAMKERLLGEIVDRLVASGVVMQPNRATYEANRNVLAGMSWPWHEKYTHQAMWDLHLPNPRNHAVFHYDWTSDDEYYWNYMYGLWGELIYQFNMLYDNLVSFNPDLQPDPEISLAESWNRPNKTTMQYTLHTEIEINATPEEVWQVLVDLDHYSEWNPFMTSAIGMIEVGQRLVNRMEPPGGRAITFKPQVTLVEDGRRLEWLGKTVISGVFDGWHRFDLQPSPTGTRLVHSEVFDGVLVRALRTSLDTRTRAGFEAMNTALKARAETAAAT